MKQQYTITSLPPSPDADRHARMVKYTIAMSIRVLCIFLMLFAQGWWLVVCAAGAIFLPYVAVVLANVSGGQGEDVPQPRQPELTIMPGGYAEERMPEASDRAGASDRPETSEPSDRTEPDDAAESDDDRPAGDAR